MLKLIRDKGVKWKSTDKKITSILIDIYTKNTFYTKLIEMIDVFFQSAELIWGETKIKKKTKEIKSEDIFSEKIATDLTTAFFTNSKFSLGEWELIIKFLSTVIKSKDLEDKYDISNVTLKKRLKPFLEFTEIKEWNKKYLAFKPKLDILGWIWFYFYFKNKDIKQNNVVLELVNLFENNL